MRTRIATFLSQSRQNGLAMQVSNSIHFQHGKVVNLPTNVLEIQSGTLFAVNHLKGSVKSHYKALPCSFHGFLKRQTEIVHSRYKRLCKTWQVLARLRQGAGFLARVLTTPSEAIERHLHQVLKPETQIVHCETKPLPNTLQKIPKPLEKIRFPSKWCTSSLARLGKTWHVLQRALTR